MARQVESEDHAVDQLWLQLSRIRACMLEVKDSGQHPQPMTRFADRKSNTIWFITSSDTDLAVAVGSGATGQLTFASEKQDYHASVRGHLSFSNDSTKLDELFTVAASAWFEQGRDDPKVRLLKFQPSDAAVWASEDNMVLVGLRLLRASLSSSEDEPDVGVHHVLNLREPA